MHKGFNVKIENASVLLKYYNVGLQQEDRFTKSAKDVLKESLMGNNVIDAGKLAEQWFPNVDADVFLSHSHCDQDLAINLSGYLHSKLGIKVFIDSCIWGSMQKLLEEFDKENCKSDSDLRYYSYEKRNHSTEHMHMLLSVALAKMIDKTKYFVLINTPESIIASNIKNGTYTSSPWIYNELYIARLLYQKPLRENVLLGQDTAFRYPVDIPFEQIGLEELVKELQNK